MRRFHVVTLAGSRFTIEARTLAEAVESAQRTYGPLVAVVGAF